MNDFPWLTVLSSSRSSARCWSALRAQGARRRRCPSRSRSASRCSRWSVGIVIAAQYDAGDGMQLTETHTWIEAFGVHYALGVDGLGLLLVLLTVVLVPVVLRRVAGTTADDRNASGVLRLGAGARGASRSAVFAATDVFLFYVVFEATLIPAYFLIGGFGREGRGRAALKFLMYQLGGGLVLLAAVIGLYVVSADAGHPVVPALRPAAARHEHDRGALAVRRLLHRVRGQGAAVPAAHLAGRHHREGDARHQRAAGLRARQDRHLRDAALLPRAVPGGLASGRRRWSSCWR